ncbi:MAG: hypothetical protein R2823_07890 [Acidimicrobiia bacterium]
MSASDERHRGQRDDGSGGNDHTDGEDDPGWPLSFLLLVTAGALYLLLRLFELVRSLVT